MSKSIPLGISLLRALYAAVAWSFTVVLLPAMAASPLTASSDEDARAVEPGYCLSLRDGEPCATAAVLPHVFMGPLGGSNAHAEIVLTHQDPNPQSCDVALLFHRGSTEAPNVLFDGEPVEGNLLRTTLPMGGARILTLTTDSGELVVGAVSVFVPSPCSADSLQVQGRYLVEDRVDGEIEEVFSVAGQAPEQWLGNGDCQVLTGVFGAGRDLGLASVTADPEQSAPAGTQLHFRAFDLEGTPTGNPSSREITGEKTASFPWDFQEPTILEMCLEVPEEDSPFRLSTIAIGIVDKGGNVQWSDEAFVNTSAPGGSETSP